MAKIKKSDKSRRQHSNHTEKKRSFCWTNMILSPNLRSNHHTCKIFASDEKNTCVINPKKNMSFEKKMPSNQRSKKQSSCVFPPLPINKIISSDSQPIYCYLPEPEIPARPVYPPPPPPHNQLCTKYSIYIQRIRSTQ